MPPVWGVLLCAWLLLTVLGTLIHVAAWDPATAAIASPMPSRDWLVKPLSNILQTATAPAWYIAWRIAGRFEDTMAAAIVNGAGWAAVLGAVGLCIRARRRMFGSGTHVVRGAEPAAPPMRPAHWSRRRFLVDGTLGAGLCGATGIIGAATLSTPWDIQLRRYRIPVRGLAPTLDGLRIVQICDTHLGPRIPADFIQTAVDRVLSLRPDLVVLVGDYVHMGPRYIAKAADLFRPLIERNPGCIGALGVLGNHDHYADADAMRLALTSIGVRMIDNSRLFIDAQTRELRTAEPPGPALCIAGLGDLLEGVVRPGTALGGVHPGTPRLVLSHNPDTAELPSIVGSVAVPGPRIDLMLCGHTHGGQVRLPFLGTPIVPSCHGSKYARGVVVDPACPVIVSAGIGMSVVPLRFGVPPELVEITLIGDDPRA